MGKVVSLREVIRYSAESKRKGLTVGFVVGSFDILHLGHVRLFRLAKKYSDVVIVGLDNDATIKLVKGDDRPVNVAKYRSQVLSDFVTIDKIFVIDDVCYHGSSEAKECFEQLIKKIQPTHIFSHPVCDRHWKDKKTIALKNKVKFIPDRSKKVTSSGEMLKKYLRNATKLK